MVRVALKRRPCRCGISAREGLGSILEMSANLGRRSRLNRRSGSSPPGAAPSPPARGRSDLGGLNSEDRTKFILPLAYPATLPNFLCRAGTNPAPRRLRRGKEGRGPTREGDSTSVPIFRAAGVVPAECRCTLWRPHDSEAARGRRTDFFLLRPILRHIPA